MIWLGASGVVYLWDESHGVLVPRAWHNYAWVQDLRFRLGEGIAGTAAQRRGFCITNDYRTSPHAHPAVLQHTEIRAVLAAAILYKDRLIGAITVNHEEERRTFTEQDRELLSLFADAAASAIENARLFEQASMLEAWREVAQLKTEFLGTVSHELRTPLSIIHGYSELLMHRAPGLSSERVTAWPRRSTRALGQWCG